MKPPWLGSSREDAELEALQTDVMRFIAILGLCLAAIFSLVHSAVLEQTAAPQAPSQEELQPPAPQGARALEPDAAPTPVAVAPAVQPVPAPEPEAPGEAAGFTLEFASAEALQSLLENARVQLYARREGRFWSVGPRGEVAPAEAPVSYYQMHADTVPTGLRKSLADSQTAGEVTWGVTLPIQTIGQIRGLMDGREGGDLVIGSKGDVKLEPR